MILIPPTPFVSRRRNAPKTLALTLVAATYNADESWVSLTFDRAIDISAMDILQFFVSDGVTMGSKYQGTDTPQVISPTSVKLLLTGVEEYTQPNVLLNAGAANGIVAADDGAAWAGCSALVLPFP